MTEKKLFDESKKKKQSDYFVRLVYLHSRVLHVLAIVSMGINSLFMIMFISDFNYGFILFAINLYVSFMGYIMIRRKRKGDKLK